MALWIDDSTIAFTADNSSNLFHLCCYVDLTNSCGTVFATMLLCNIAQGTGAAQVAYRIAYSMAENVVCNADEGVLFSKHLSVFADKCQTVNIGIDNDAEIKTSILHLVHDAMKIFLQWLGIMCEVASALSVENLVIYSYCIEESWQDDTSYRVDGIYTHTELTLLYSLNIGKLKFKHRVDMLLIEGVVF